MAKEKKKAETVRVIDAKPAVDEKQQAILDKFDALFEEIDKAATDNGVSTDYSGTPGAAFRVFGEVNPEDEINTRFTYHAPRGDQNLRYVAIRAAAKVLAKLVNKFVPPSRERELALTALDMVVMWANSAIARREA